MCSIRKLVCAAAVALVSLSAGNVFAQGTDNGSAPVSVAPQDMRYQQRYRFGTYDRVEVEVFKHPEYSLKADVGQDGTIVLPRINQPVMALCKTERELADEITKQYSRIMRQPFVTVRAAEQKSQSFAVIGAVDKPGAFFLSRRIQLLELVSYAGGPNREAGAKIYVIRKGNFSVCKNDIADAQNMANDNGDPNKEALVFEREDVLAGKVNMWMQPGDVVNVQEAQVVYVVGNVNKPSAIRLRKETTLSQAIAAAEGTKPSTKKDKIRILRKKPDSLDPEVIYVDLNAIEKRQIADPVLQPDDIVAVNEDSTKAIGKAVINALIGGVSSLPYLLIYK